MLTPRLHLHVLGRERPAFRVCGLTGVALAVAISLSIVAVTGHDLLVMAVIAVAGAATFLTLVAAGVVWRGEERLVYYHHEIAVLAVAAAVAAALGQPVLPYLDATAVGLGAFLACGRIGCLMVGCCHGRPHPRGVRYGPEHASAGLADVYVGVPLFPVQAAESAWALALAVAGIALAVGGAAPGTVAALYVSAYAVARFWLELARGDAERSYRLGLSQAQWLSIVCSLAVVAGGLAGVAPWHAAHAVAAGALVLAGAVLVRRRPEHPAHMQELVSAVRAALDTGDAPPRVRVTSSGVAVSGGMLPGEVAHFTLSGPRVTTGLAARIERIVATLRPGAQVVVRPLKGARVSRQRGGGAGG